MSPGKSVSRHDRPDEDPKRPTKQPRLEEAEGSKAGETKEEPMVAEAEEGLKEAKPAVGGKTKLKACNICGKADDHISAFCPWTYRCLSNAKVGPDCEILCFCCGDDVEVAHPNELVVARAAFKPSYWPKKNYALEFGSANSNTL